MPGEDWARWRVDYIGKGGKHLGTVEAGTRRSAIEQVARQFHITPAQRFKIRVTHTQASEKHARDS
jgi:hypothetical protein